MPTADAGAARGRATAFLFFTGNPGSGPVAENIAFNQHIAGGTLASTLAGEYSYTLALAFALAFLGTLAYALRTGRLLWIPAVLFACAVMSHLVVAIFAALGALVVLLASRPDPHHRSGRRDRSRRRAPVPRSGSCPCCRCCNTRRT